MSEYEELARKGAALLDEEVPDWRERVNPARLHLADPCGCVLGQVFGSYYSGISRLNLRDGGESAGFYLEDGSAGQYGWLTRAWRKVLRNG